MKIQDKELSALNITGRLAQYFLHSKITILFIILSILVGILAILFTPRTYNPEIVVPTVNITVNRPGSNVQEILNQIVAPLESLLSAIPGVDHTYGMAMKDRGTVSVKFKVNEDEERSLVKVYNQINTNLDKIPPGTELPLIQSVSLYDVPIVTITLSSSHYDPSTLREVSLRLLEQLRNVPKVGKTWVLGSSEHTVHIWLNPGKLAFYHISLDQIIQSLKDNNVAFEAGHFFEVNQEIPLRVYAELHNIDEIGKVMVSKSNNQPIFLRDLAKIEMGPLDENIYSFFGYGLKEKKGSTGNQNLESAVTIALARQKGSNGVDVADAILGKLNEIKLKAIPDDITMTVTRDYGKEARDAVNKLVEHLGIAIIGVVFILLIFLGWREALIVTLSIPLIIFVVLGVGWVMGQTLNRITLFALILSLGLLVDDSIVVIENIHRYIKKQISTDNLSRLITLAANEIGKPTVVATFTVILALLPMAFVTGMMGPFMGPIPFNAPLAMFVSLVVAYTIVPFLAFQWLKFPHRKEIQELSKVNKTKELKGKEEPEENFFSRYYRRYFYPLILNPKKRYLFYIIVLVLLLMAVFQPIVQFVQPGGSNGPLNPLAVELKMLPDDNVNSLLLEIDAEAGTAIEETNRIVDAIVQIVGQNPFVKNYQTFIGEAAPEDFAAIVRGDHVHKGSQFAQIRVNLIDKNDRSRGSHAISQDLYVAILTVRDRFPNVRFKLFETPPGPPVRSQMMAGIYGPDYATLERLADNICKTIYPKVYGLINIDDSVPKNSPEYKIMIDQNAAEIAGFSPERIANELKTYFGGISVGYMHEKDKRESENIILRLPPSARTNLNVLNSLYILNNKEQPVPISNFIRIQKGILNKPIFTQDQHQVAYVTGEMLRSSPVYAVDTVTSLLNNHFVEGVKLDVDNLKFRDSTPDDLAKYQVFWLGEMRLTLDVFRDLGAAFMVAIFLIYFLLTAYYQSFFLPIIIMGSIPLTLIGVFPGHWIMHQPFTATSMIGVIALSGIVVRNSLLLIDCILEGKKQGMSFQSSVLEAGAVRILPIILTALAIILSSSIMLADPVFGGLAISLVFGAFASTVLTLFIIPLLYYDWSQSKLSM